MGFHDFPAQGQAEAGTCCFRRVERQQCIPEHVLCQPGATVGDLDHKAFHPIADADGDVIGPRARFRCIFQQIDHHLLHLARVEASLAQGQRPFEVKWHRSLQRGHEL